MNEGGAVARRLSLFLKTTRNEMKKLLNLALAALLFAAFSIAPTAPSMALVTDPNKIITTRDCGGEQNLCFLRVTVNFNDPGIASGVWFATVPKNAYILAIDVSVTTAFNAATTNLLTLGATKSSANEIVADCGTATACVSNHTTTIGTGISHLTTAAGLATAITGNTTYQTALNGDVPLYAKFAQTGTAATTGVATFVIIYAANIDR